MYDPLRTAVSHNERKGDFLLPAYENGFSRSTYYAMKRGDNISSHTVDQLFRILQCGVSDIMEYVDENDSSDST